MSNKFEDPFANIPNEKDPKIAAKKAVWKSHEITKQLAKEIEEVEEPSQLTQVAPEKFGPAIDKNLIAEKQITALKGSTESGRPLLDAIGKSIDVNRLESISPSENEEDDEYLKGKIPDENDKKRAEYKKKKDEYHKKQDIDKFYS